MPLSREEWREIIAGVEDDLAMARENAVAAAQIDVSAVPGLERMAAAAFLSERAYTACEAALERLAKAFGDLPAHSATYHKDLLDLYARPWSDIRPALISEPTLALLDLLRKYRHFLRHAYGVQWFFGNCPGAPQHVVFRSRRDRLEIAQQFTAGGLSRTRSPVPEGRLKRDGRSWRRPVCFSRPFGTDVEKRRRTPALKHWAIVSCP